MNRNMKFSGFIFSLGFFSQTEGREMVYAIVFTTYKKKIDTLHDIFKFKKMTRRSKILYKWLDKKGKKLANEN